MPGSREDASLAFLLRRWVWLLGDSRAGGAGWVADGLDHAERAGSRFAGSRFSNAASSVGVVATPRT